MTFLHTEDSLTNLSTSKLQDRISPTSHNNSYNFFPNLPSLIIMQHVEFWDTSNPVQAKAYFFLDSNLHLLGFSDSDWAGCKDIRRSILGSYFFIVHSLISWRTKKQKIVSRSSIEVWYRALAATTCELQWILHLLRDLQITCVKPLVIYCDKQSALHIAANPVFDEKTKHLEIDFHFVREKFQVGIPKLLPISPKINLLISSSSAFCHNHLLFSHIS